jgi:hypothetical protein
MGLLQKILGGQDRSGPQDPPPSGTRFEESDDRDESAVEREASRRELVKLVLRETMRRHAVPSDWIECRLLPVVTSNRRTGLHVQLVVKQGQGSLLRYIPAFQSSMMAEIEKFDARAWDWLLSISWQFAGITSTTGGELPGDGEWQMGQSRNAALGPAGGAPAAPPKPQVEDDVAEDLKALFAIRDAALQPTAPPPEPDFEATRPSGFSQSGGTPLR